HMARQCTKQKRLRNSSWFKEKMLLVQAQESGQVLDEEQLTLLADPGILEAKAVLMANLSSYDSNVLSKVPQRNSYQNDDMLNQNFENGLHSVLNEVKMVFNQMEAAVEQCSVDKKYFDIQKKEVSLDNDDSWTI
nr:retrovirus-related Pol polyprotein from transposon TNT 1-94 [Tanacetum cinerariifolium]